MITSKKAKSYQDKESSQVKTDWHMKITRNDWTNLTLVIYPTLKVGKIYDPLAQQISFFREFFIIKKALVFTTHVLHFVLREV